MYLYLLTIVVILAIYYCFTMKKRLDYWKDRNIPYTGAITLLKDIMHIMWTEKSFALYNSDKYMDYPIERYCGHFQSFRPVLLLRDIELIKDICIKDFDHFIDHVGFIDTNLEPVMGKNLFQLKGHEWKKMRTAISPVFTTMKIKSMFILMQECADNFIKFFLDKNQDIVEVEMRDIFTRFTNDVIATTAFGIRINSLKEPNNEFYLMGKSITNFNIWQGMKLLLSQMCPLIIKLFRLRLFSPEQTNFFTKIIKETMKKREKENIIRPDLINIFIEARKLQNEETDLMETSFKEDAMKHLTEDEMIAQALVFFFAGFESVAAVPSFMAYELARNPEIQNKLQNEIDSIKDDLTYDKLVELKYLDQVVSETMRLWPPGFQIDRLCVKDYIINDKKPLLIEKGVGILVPLMGIARDPKYFPDPLRFDPERFNEENKANIHPCTFLPFGAGPRTCIASRFALIEIKVVMFYLLANFTIVPTEKTHIPVELDGKSFNLSAKHGLWFGFKRRSH